MELFVDQQPAQPAKQSELVTLAIARKAKKIKAKRASHPVKKASAIKLCQAWQDAGKPSDVSKQLGGIKSTNKVKSSQTHVRGASKAKQITTKQA